MVVTALAKEDEEEVWDEIEPSGLVHDGEGRGGNENEICVARGN